MKKLLIIVSALLLTACFSEDMKSGQSNSGQEATTVSALQFSLASKT